ADTLARGELSRPGSADAGKLAVTGARAEIHQARRQGVLPIVRPRSVCRDDGAEQLMQPVANAAPEPRGVDNLVRLIASGSLDPVSVTVREERALLAAFKSKESKLLDRMKVHVARGADR